MAPDRIDIDDSPSRSDLARLIDLDRLDLLDFRRLFRFHIQSIEVTQAIQYYRAAAHLTDPADRQPDNAVTLIVGKPAWVRVYVRSGLLSSDIPNVTGTLEVSRRQFGFLYSPVGTLSPQPPGVVTARSNPAYATERGTLNRTLNFIIPAAWMCGHLRLRVTLSAPGGHLDERTFFFNVTLRQTLRVAGIMVGYNGPASTAPGAPNITLAAPTIANLQTTSAWTLLVFPVQSTATYRSAGTITWNLPLTDAPLCPGCCTSNWLALNAAVQAQRTADGNQPGWLYYGLMAVGIPMGPIIGCNSGGVSTGSNTDGVTMAHELGHACGLAHGPCGTPGDPAYPAYEPYDPVATPNASIGEYGLDISNGNIFSPAMFKDFMSYCGPRWISLYHHGRLINNPNLLPARTCVDYPWWRDIVLYEPILIPERWLPDPPPDPIWRKRIVEPEPVISIIGVIHPDDVVEIKTVMRLDAVREIPGGRVTGLTADLLGADGRVMASAPVYRVTSFGQGCGCGGGDDDRHPHVFQAYLADAGPGAALLIRREEKEVWMRRAPAVEPRVIAFKARLKKPDQLHVEWRVSCADEYGVEHWLQWSGDRGESWNALVTGLRGMSAAVDASGLPAGRVMIRLLAGDGFHTARSKPVAVTVPRRAATVAILAPRDGQTLVAGTPMRLWGVATRSTGEPVPEKSLRWLLDGKEVHRGVDVFIPAPEAGEHRLALVSIVDGKRAEHVIKFKTVHVPAAAEQGD